MTKNLAVHESPRWPFFFFWLVAGPARPLAARAQEPTMPMIGYLSYTSAEY